MKSSLSWLKIGLGSAALLVFIAGCTATTTTYYSKAGSAKTTGYIGIGTYYPNGYYYNQYPRYYYNQRYYRPGYFRSGIYITNYPYYRGGYNHRPYYRPAYYKRPYYNQYYRGGKIYYRGGKYYNRRW